VNKLENLLENLKEEENNVLTRKKQLADDEKRVKDIQLLIFCEKSGLKAGDIVEYKGKKYAFHSLYSYADNLKHCWALGNLIKKDDTLSESTKLLYNEWVKV